jgi:prepilin-type N-terminal cleavage/methylation domain-containing protein
VKTKSDHGFTLVELLIATVVLGIIIYPLTEAVILALRTTDKTVTSVAGSTAVQTLAAYFYADVNSATQVTTGAGTACPTSQGVVRLHLTWTDQSSGLETDVLYALSAPDPRSGSQQLLRIDCSHGNLINTQTLGEFDYAQLSCGYPSGSGTTTTTSMPQACPTGSGGVEPDTVSLTIDTEPGGNSTTLTGQRRSST